MNSPRYSYTAINALSLGDTGHFLYLDAWTVSLIGSMLSQERALHLWTNNQFPLTQLEIDDLDNKLSIAQGQIMQSMVGLIMPIVNMELPFGTLLCDGGTYARVDYPNLYSVLDPVFIIDSDMFTTPDLRDRFVMGASVTNTEGSTGGSDTVTQTEAQMPIHSHTTQPHAHAESAAAPTAIAIGPGVPAPSALPAASSTGLATVIVNSAGGNEPMTITPKYTALRYVVVAL